MADPKGYSGLSRVLGALGGLMLGGAVGFVAMLGLGFIPYVGGALALGAFFLTPIYGAYKGYQVVKKSQEEQAPVVYMQAPSPGPAQAQTMEGPAPAPEQAMANAPSGRPEFLDTILKHGKGAATPARVEQTQGTGTGPTV